MNILKLAKDFTQLMNDELSPEQISKVVELNQSEPIPFTCHSHDFCDPNQVMIDAMAKQNEEFDAQNYEQGCAINQAWDFAKKAKFDAAHLIFLAAGCVTISSKRAG